MSVSLKKLSSGIEEQLQKMVDRSKSMQGYLDRIVYRQYQNAQRERWKTENASEGDRWMPLSTAYQYWKADTFADFPGGGTKMLIASGRLFNAVVGPGPEHKKIVTEKSLEVAWSTPYAEYVGETRPFNYFGNKTMENIYDGLSEFLIKGIFRDLK